MLFPFFPLRPQRLAARSPEPSRRGSADIDLRLRRGPGLGGRMGVRFGLPPRIAATDRLGERACLCSADVIEMHSDMTKDTGSTATETGRLLYCIREEMMGVRQGRDTAPGDTRPKSIVGTVEPSRFILQGRGRWVRNSSAPVSGVDSNLWARCRYRRGASHSGTRFASRKIGYFARSIAPSCRLCACRFEATLFPPRLESPDDKRSTLRVKQGVMVW